jgi:hypothetical protein
MTSPAGNRRPNAPFDTARVQDARYSTRFTPPALAAAEEAKSAEAVLEFTSEGVFFPERAVARISHGIVMGSAAVPSERTVPGLCTRRSLLWLVLVVAAGVPAVWGVMQLRQPVPEVAASQPSLPAPAAPVVREAAATPVVVPPVAAPRATPVSQAAPKAVAKPAALNASNPPAKPVAVVARREPQPEKVASPAPPAPTTIFLGGMRIESDPAGAHVFVNGQPMGSTPLALQDLPAGSRVVRIVADGYQPWSTAVRVVANQQTRVTATLQRSSTP